MTTRKNYNSIVFLAAFFGLVLVGGTPPVLAHAAMTRQFDIQNEIKFKDDLDKKPDGNPSFQEIDISNVLINFLNDLQKLQANEPDNYEQEKNFYARRERLVYSNNSLGLESPIKAPSPSKLDKSFEKLFNSLDNEGLRNIADFVQETTNEKPVKRISFEIYPALELSVKLLICFKKDSSQKASLLTDQLNMEFRFRAYNAERKFVKQIYENTEATFENNQVFIVTRLPRGSLDALLAKDAH